MCSGDVQAHDGVALSTWRWQRPRALRGTSHPRDASLSFAARLGAACTARRAAAHGGTATASAGADARVLAWRVRGRAGALERRRGGRPALSRWGHARGTACHGQQRGEHADAGCGPHAQAGRPAQAGVRQVPQRQGGVRGLPVQAMRKARLHVRLPGETPGCQARTRRVHGAEWHQAGPPPSFRPAAQLTAQLALSGGACGVCFTDSGAEPPPAGGAARRTGANRGGVWLLAGQRQ
mmetsp:Transcript_22292/g.57267  ORF Transcript_22292/g.57267 Transcript_22292/m.57267 type:complete len:237 (+) Transcript_22292:1343-2053(+)